jgi:hypothetical protein
MLLISIQLDKPRNPNVADYDMKILPANYLEAAQRPDFNMWKATVVKELTMLKSMGIYLIMSLPANCKAIGNC